LKKYRKIAYIALIILVLLSGFFIYKVLGKNDTSEDIKSKSLAEIKFLEGKFLGLFNQMNNISFENYKISSIEVPQKETKEQGSNSSKSSNNGQSDGENNDNSGSSQGSGSSSSENSNSSKEQNKQYKLEEVGILTKDSEVDWNYIKNEVEDIYTFLYPMTLDLYQTRTNQDDIVNFNKEFDKLTKAVKEENKEETLKELSILYGYYPKFVDNCTEEQKEKILIRTKNYIFKAYSILDSEDWNAISENVNNGIQEITKLVTSITSEQKDNQYNINKAYIIINELQNAVALKDKEVFLIKYKNLLEELQNI
jgi:hypothetical protein